MGSSAWSASSRGEGALEVDLDKRFPLPFCSLKGKSRVKRVVEGWDHWKLIFSAEILHSAPPQNVEALLGALEKSSERFLFSKVY